MSTRGKLKASTASKSANAVRTLHSYFIFSGNAGVDETSPAVDQLCLPSNARKRALPSSSARREKSTKSTKSKATRVGIPPASSKEIVRLHPAPSAKAPYRFYNRTLRGVYESCSLPTDTAATAANMILSSTYSTSVEQRSSVWRHTICTPPITYTGLPLSLAIPFSKHNLKSVLGGDSTERPSKVAKGKASFNSPEIPSSTTIDASDPVDDATKKRKRVPFKRAVPLEGYQRSWKIRMLPTKEQAIELKNCISVVRKAYNFANRRVRDDKAPANRIKLQNDWEKMDHPPEVKAVASRFARGGINDLVDAYKSNYAKLKHKPHHKFVVLDRDEFESRTETLQVDRKDVLLEVIPVKKNPEWVLQRRRREKEAQALGIISSTPIRPAGGWRKRRSECLLRFGNSLEVHGPIRIQGKQKTIDAIVRAGKDLQAAARIQWDKHADAFYFIWRFELPALQDPDPAFEHKTIVALDPGCTPFQKWYSPTSGMYGELLSDARQDLKLHCVKIDHLRQRIGKRIGNPQRFTTTGRRVQPGHTSKRKRQRLTRSLRKKLRRECRRLSGHMHSGHYDAANFLLRHHDVVIAPILATTRLTDKTTRCFGSTLARTMYTWSHYLFRQRLAFAAARYPGRHVFECVEPGTSKTCTSCGWWNPSLKLGDKVCRCPRCSIVVDRQLTGARNNFFAAYGMALGVGWDGVGR